MSEIRSIHSNKDEWENLVIDIYQEPQSDEKDSREDWRDICHIHVSNYRELNTINKFIGQFTIIEINGGRRALIPSTDESKQNEWIILRDDLLKKEVLKRIEPEHI